jgi:hypothetical protein
VSDFSQTAGVVSGFSQTAGVVSGFSQTAGVVSGFSQTAGVVSGFSQTRIRLKPDATAFEVRMGPDTTLEAGCYIPAPYKKR